MNVKNSWRFWASIDHWNLEENLEVAPSPVGGQPFCQGLPAFRAGDKTRGALRSVLRDATDVGRGARRIRFHDARHEGVVALNGRRVSGGDPMLSGIVN